MNHAKIYRPKNLYAASGLVSRRFSSRGHFFVLLLSLGEQPGILSTSKALLTRDQVGLIPLGTLLG